MTPQERLDAQRRKRLAADRALLAELTREQQKAFQAVRRELAKLTRQISEARAKGETVNPAWLFQRQRLDRFERELGTEIALYLDLAKRKIEAAKVRALIDGQGDARELLLSTLPQAISVTPALPLAQLHSVVLNTQLGTPLGNLLAGLGAEAARGAREKLVEGVALGLGTREIGRNLRDSFAGNSIRALLVARTEVIRTYRDSALQTYKQNRGVIKGWLWIAQLGPRTCPVCIAKHGSFHSLEESFASHPACRCSPAPKTKTWTELGFPDDIPETGLDPEPGEDWFARQSAVTQEAILSPGKYRLYRDGEIKLDDLVQETVHPVWGRGVRERALRDFVA